MEEITITGLQEKMDSGALNARRVTEMYLVCIDKLDQQGPALNTVIELNPDALARVDLSVWTKAQQ
jgi:amidase